MEGCNCFFLLLFFRFTALQAATALMRTNKTVTLVTLHIGANPIYGYYLSVPVYKVAVRHIRERYPEIFGNLSHVAVYQPGYDLCAAGADHTTETFIKYYYEHPEIFKSDQIYPVLASPGNL